MQILAKDKTVFIFKLYTRCLLVHHPNTTFEVFREWILTQAALTANTFQGQTFQSLPYIHTFHCK